jgi:hypothetical protein
MARHTLARDWQAPAEFSSERMGQGPASLCIIDEPSTQRHGGRHNLLNGEIFQRTGDTAPQVEYLGQKRRLKSEFSPLCHAMDTRHCCNKVPQQAEYTLLNIRGSLTLLKQAYESRIGVWV